jgi:hypothetical protein
MLGVRIDGSCPDIVATNDGMVFPKMGGMSVVVDSPANLPNHRRPRSLNGEGRDPVFEMELKALPQLLTCRIDKHPHALVEPSEFCVFLDYETALYGTCPLWEKSNE